MPTIKFTENPNGPRTVPGFFKLTYPDGAGEVIVMTDTLPGGMVVHSTHPTFRTGMYGPDWNVNVMKACGGKLEIEF